MPEPDPRPLPHAGQIVHPLPGTGVSDWEPHLVLAVHAPVLGEPVWLWLISTTTPEIGPLTQPAYAWSTEPAPHNPAAFTPGPAPEHAAPTPRRFEYPCGF